MWDRVRKVRINTDARLFGFDRHTGCHTGQKHYRLNYLAPLVTVVGLVSIPKEKQKRRRNRFFMRFPIKLRSSTLGKSQNLRQDDCQTIVRTQERDVRS